MGEDQCKRVDHKMLRCRQLTDPQDVVVYGISMWSCRQQKRQHRRLWIIFPSHWAITVGKSAVTV